MASRPAPVLYLGLLVWQWSSGLAKFDIYAFGETRFSTGNMFTDRLYTGQRWIAELGIYHFNARFYSPKLGRFLSADTMMSGFANPQNLNRFSYAANNPLRYTDPTGHMICEVCPGEGGDFPNGYGYFPPPPPPPSDGGSTNTPTGDGSGSSTGGSSDGSSGDSGGGDGGPGGEPIDPNEKYPEGYCWDYNSLVGCTQDGVPLYMGDESVEIDRAEFDEMTSYLIQQAQQRTKWDLIVNAWRFDTPFYDNSFFGLGKLSGTGCVFGQCYTRDELNYVGEGVLWARVGVSKSVGHTIVQIWKLLPLGHAPFQSPSGGTLEMFDRGYDTYMEANSP